MTQAAMLADLKRSGLTRTHAQKCKMKVLSSTQTKKLNGQFGSVACYQIPYFTIDGKVDKDYWRVRALEEIKGKFGAKLKKPRRYSGPSDAVPRFYMPPIIDWKDVAQDRKTPIVITEGEKKAIKGCAAGLATISIPGVWAWKSKKNHMRAIPDFDKFKWDDRDVFLCFDNDMYSNPDVLIALQALADELHKHRGAKVYIKYLPKSEQKIALDDYLMTHTAEQWVGLEQQEYGPADALHRINAECIFVRKRKAVYSFRDEEFMSVGDFKNANYANHTHIEYAQLANGDVRAKTVDSAPAWIKWPHRAECDDVCYRPGQPQITPDGKLNLYSGLGVEPKKGSVKPFMDLLKYLCPEADIREWLLKWLAYPLQNPGTKVMQAVILYSPHQGTGKSFLGYIVKDIYGKQGSKIGQSDLHGDYNNWAVRKQFIMGEEITGSDRKADADNLKALITQETIYVKQKYIDSYEIEDFAQHYFTTNHSNALFLDEYDRRFLVIALQEKPKPLEFYQAVDDWRNNDGPAHLLHYLLELDTTGYGPKVPAPGTEAKQEMIEYSKSAIERWCEELVQDPDSVLRMGRTTADDELWTPGELLAFTPPQYSWTDATLGRILKKVGRPNKRLKDHKGRARNVYAIRNTEHWDKHWNNNNMLRKQLEQQDREVKFDGK